MVFIMAKPTTQIRSHSRNQTEFLTNKLRSEGRSYVVVNRRGNQLAAWSAPPPVANPGRGAPGPVPQPVLSGSGSSISQAFGPRRSIFEMGPGSPRPFPTTAAHGEFLMTSYLTPAGGWVLEPSNLERELPQVLSGIETWNHNAQYWREQVLTFALENPELSVPLGIVGASGAAATVGAGARALAPLLPRRTYSPGFVGPGRLGGTRTLTQRGGGSFHHALQNLRYFY